MTAEEIVAAAEGAYARCRTYADSGCVRTVFLSTDGNGDFVSTRPFRTAFVRPDRFRFEFSGHHPDRSEINRYIVAADGPAVQTWWDVRPGVERPESLGLALAGATGVSGGSAYTVPALLMPDQLSGLTDRFALSRLDDGELDGVPCFRIERRTLIDPDEARRQHEEAVRFLGKEAPEFVECEDGPDVLWFDRTSFLVRRIESRSRCPTFRTESVTTYEPAIDEPVPEEHLLFDALVLEE